MLELLIKGGSVVDGTGAATRVVDIGIAGGKIVEIGEISSSAERVIDARGLIVTPGWIDIHTHYDGQATWDPLLDPSFSSGVTTAVLGNCGVGFAPVRTGEEDRLIELMEGVEEIPGTALHAGIRWRWNSFPEYLDALDEMPRTFDIAALLPHGPLRQYVMRDKVGTDKCAGGKDLEEITDLIGAAMDAGAFGVSSSRTRMHRTSAGGMTADFEVDAPELLAIARTVAGRNGILEFAPTGVTGEDFDGLKRELTLYQQIVAETGVALHFLLLQTTNDRDDFWAEQVKWAERVNLSGKGEVYGLVGGRPLGALLGFLGAHPFMDRPTFLRIKKLPKDQWYGELAQPETRAAILAEENEPQSTGEFLTSLWPACYEITHGIDYEPTDEKRLENVAQSKGLTAEERAYDLMVGSPGSPALMIVLANYHNGSLDALGEMMASKGTLLSLSDAGAHSMTICDGTIHTFMLTHWVRDRRTGKRKTLEEVVKLMTSDPARAFRLADRGVLAPGYKADINIIDLDKLTAADPAYVDDLPADETRLLQRVSGYRATIVSGVVTRENDVPTGALPGKLVRFNGLKTA